MSTILVTGGSGYIGSHTILALLRAGFEVISVDNFSNSSRESLERISVLTGQNVINYQVNLDDAVMLNDIFSKHAIDCVIHFAGLKSVGESIKDPLLYFKNNVAGSLSLLAAMAQAGVHKLIFSSSATVYGDPQSVPILETAGIGVPSNPYGRSKIHVEEVLGDLCRSDSRWSIAILRYFNPIGADASGVIGEDPNGVPSNLLPYIVEVGAGEREFLPIFGDDYATPDGTCIRDFIHVSDLAEGHLCAYHWISRNSGAGIWNLGAGRGVSVKELISKFEEITGISLNVKIFPRRDGDLPEIWSDVSLAAEQLSWRATRTLEEMLRDHWRWKELNPNGYEDQYPLGVEVQ